MLIVTELPGVSVRDLLQEALRRIVNQDDLTAERAEVIAALGNVIAKVIRFADEPRLYRIGETIRAQDLAGHFGAPIVGAADMEHTGEEKDADAQYSLAPHFGATIFNS